jgi:hypothetical protein
MCLGLPIGGANVCDGVRRGRDRKVSSVECNIGRAHSRRERAEDCAVTGPKLRDGTVCRIHYPEIAAIEGDALGSITDTKVPMLLPSLVRNSVTVLSL